MRAVSDVVRASCGASRAAAWLALAALASARPAAAEPMFLSKQYTRCSSCHYSAYGGGLLTPYGRSLSREALSTFGKSTPAPGEGDGTGEERFLWGALGDALGPVGLGIELRPSHVNIDVGPSDLDRELFMTADLQAAFRKDGFTLYALIGRQPRSSGAEIDSAEHWLGYESAKGLGVRLGRFMPAYGIHLADHTAFTRASLGFDTYDQVYGLELSHAAGRHLLQLTLSPGRADAILDDDGTKAFIAAGRFQLDLNPKSALVLSGVWRDASTLLPKSGSFGAAYGFAAGSRLSVWTQADARFESGRSGTGYTLLNETSLEVRRGVWLKFSPQLVTVIGQGSAGVFRTAWQAVLLPAPHWNVNLSYYRDDVRDSPLVLKTLLLQLHLYL